MILCGHMNGKLVNIKIHFEECHFAQHSNTEINNVCHIICMKVKNSRTFKYLDKEQATSYITKILVFEFCNCQHLF